MTVTPLAQRRPRAAVRARRVRRGAASRRAPSVGEAGNADADVERQLQLAVVVQTAEMVGAAQDGVRLHARVGVQPLLVRSSAGVVPGDQAPLRRHEDVARGEPRAGRRRGAREVQAEAPGAGETSARPRRTPATTSPSSCRTACRCTAASASPTSTTSTCILRRITVDRLTYGTPTDHRQRIAALREAHAA